MYSLGIQAFFMYHMLNLYHCATVCSYAVNNNHSYCKKKISKESISADKLNLNRRLISISKAKFHFRYRNTTKVRVYSKIIQNKALQFVQNF